MLKNITFCGPRQHYQLSSYQYSRRNLLPGKRAINQNIIESYLAIVSPRGCALVTSVHAENIKLECFFIHDINDLVCQTVKKNIRYFKIIVI